MFRTTLLITFYLMIGSALMSQVEKMEIEGAIQIGDSEDPLPDEGTIRYNPVSNDFEGWNGERWKSLTENGTVRDFEGNIYNTTAIGAQIWMSESLRSTKLRDGTPIPEVQADMMWVQQTGPAYSWWNNDKIKNQFPYGAYYNWYAIKEDICPEGWRVPDRSDYIELFNFIGNDDQSAYLLMTADTAYWNSYTPLANNLTGFNGIEGGYRNDGSGSFNPLFSEYWTTSNSFEYA